MSERMTWLGRPVEDLTREELIEALMTTHRMYLRAVAQAQHDISFMAGVANAAARR